MDDVGNFILKLKSMYEKDENIRKIILNFPELILALEYLQKLVEMYAVKSIIIKNIQMLIIIAYKALLSGKALETLYRGHMLHTVFYGNPGVGKSHSAKCLARIWKALGVLKKINKEEKKIKSHDILTHINSSRKDFLTLYENYKKNSKVSYKTVEVQWESVKNNLKLLGDEMVEQEVVTINSKDMDEVIVICGREDFVAEYAGQTSIKTLNFIKKNLGKCIIIEEAYLLYNGESDHYGMEAITVLNRCMDEYADSLIIIFTGYEELLLNTIFKAQPGLRRRCQWIFNLQGYSSLGLSKIFEQQITNLGWSISSDVHIIDFFESKLDHFLGYGGDTERLALHCKMQCTGDVFSSLYDLLQENKKLESEDLQLIVTSEVLEKGYNEYLKNKI
jgi:hypothetical protein